MSLVLYLCTYTHTAMILPYFYKGLYFGAVSWLMFMVLISCMCVFSVFQSSGSFFPIVDMYVKLKICVLCMWFVFRYVWADVWNLLSVTVWMLLLRFFQTDVMAAVVLFIMLSYFVMFLQMNFWSWQHEYGAQHGSSF
jgi:hypothetical protein